ncbi:tetratricopeptide repeat protein [Candidatus Riflebacteria bacterium]
MECPSCKTEVDKSQEICPKCGQKMKSMWNSFCNWMGGVLKNEPPKQAQTKSSDLEGDSSVEVEDFEEDDDDIMTKYAEGTGEGIEEVKMVLEADPNNVDLLDWLAFMYYSNKKIDEAIETYKKALAINPNNENHHYYLANSYFKKGMVVEAKKEWEQVIKLAPDSKMATNAEERIKGAMEKM